VRAHQRLGVAVVGHHHGNLDLERACAVPEQQVVETVQVLGNHDQRAVGSPGVPQLERHPELAGHAREPAPQVLGVG
jgi:hypothetical protein